MKKEKASKEYILGLKRAAKEICAACAAELDLDVLTGHHLDYRTNPILTRCPAWPIQLLLLKLEKK